MQQSLPELSTYPSSSRIAESGQILPATLLNTYVLILSNQSHYIPGIHFQSTFLVAHPNALHACIAIQPIRAYFSSNLLCSNDRKYIYLLHKIQFMVASTNITAQARTVTMTTRHPAAWYPSCAQVGWRLIVTRLRNTTDFVKHVDGYV